MRKNPNTPAGTVHRLTLDSQALQGNLLGDPTRRIVDVYVPHGHDGGGLPLLVDVVGFTAGGPAHTNWKNFGENLPERLDRLIGEGHMPPAVVAFPDCFTRLGGNQYVNSAAMGRWDDFLLTEAVPLAEGRFGCGGAGRRGIFGKSSGGYGAMVTPMLRPDLFSGLATHAGDAAFEACYLPEFRDAARALRDAYDGSFDRFWEDFRSRPAFTKSTDFPLLNTYAMAACYSANEDGSIDLPFDVSTGLLVPEVWERWLRWDPVRMVDRHADALRGLRAIYVDAGTRDEYFLDLGAEAFRQALERIGVTDVRFELFDAKHGGIEYRYPGAIRYLAERLQPA